MSQDAECLLSGCSEQLLSSCHAITGGKEKILGFPSGSAGHRAAGCRISPASARRGAAGTHLGEDVLVFDDVLVGGEQDVEFPAAELRYECPSCCRRALQGELPREMLRQGPRPGKESHGVLEKKGDQGILERKKKGEPGGPGKKGRATGVLEKKRESHGVLEKKKKGRATGSQGKRESHGVLAKKGRGGGRSCYRCGTRFQ